MNLNTIRFFDFKKDTLEEIINLGDLNSKTLGHLPHDAYKDYAKRNGIIVCKRKSVLVGYCLFRRQKRNNQIKIAQLCVDPNYRGEKISDTILDFMKREFRKHYKGISLNCRRDFQHACKVWERNHFFPEEEKRSRSKKENYLIQWYHNFNHLDLFTSVRDTKIKALFDLNVIIKLRELEEGIDINNEEVKYLVNDDISTEVDYYYAKESFNEITRDEKRERRIVNRKILRSFKESIFKQSEFREVYKRIEMLSPPKNQNDKSDRKQLAECITNNIPYFITTDVNLKKSCRKIEEHFNITILLPSEFIIKFDQLQNSESFLPRGFGGIQSEICKVTHDNLNSVIDEFFNRNVEVKSEFKRKVSLYSANPKNSLKVIIHRGEMKAFIAFQFKGKNLTVEYIRLKSCSLKQILLNQIITELIQEAVDLNAARVEIPKTEIDQEGENLLSEFKFFESNEKLIKFIFCGAFQAKYIIQDQSIKKFINSTFLDSEIQQEQKYELERVIFPGKIKELDIQNLIIPIKPYWASQLFDKYMSGLSLFGAKEKLQWTKRNVYFRSVRPNVEEVPARILWYVSNDPRKSLGNRPKGVVACSYLENFHIDDPKSIYSQFKKVGIYSWEDILKLCKNDFNTKIKAIEFSDTEVFKKSVPLKRLQQVLGKKHSFQSPLKITRDEFFNIYLDQYSDE